MELFSQVGLGVVVIGENIDVVIPTYNGFSHLFEQVASIANQSRKPARLLVRDDGSTDGSLNLLDELEYIYGSHWLQVLPRDNLRLGCIGNVNRLLEATTAPYVALADQDDYWFTWKLERSMALMRDLELRYGAGAPLLVHGDLGLIDVSGRSLGSTYTLRQRLDPMRTCLSDLSITNVVTGCSALMNRALLEKALPIPIEALMHDWWLALVSSAFGAIGYFSDPCMGYRQHEANVLGAPGLGWRYWYKRLLSLSLSKAAPLDPVLRQMAAFEKRYQITASILPSLMTLPRCDRYWELLQTPLEQWPAKHGPLRTAGLYFLIATSR